MKVTIYWRTKNRDKQDKIRDKFHLPYYTTVNGETEGEVNDELIDLLRECEKRGFIKIRKIEYESK